MKVKLIIALTAAFILAHPKAVQAQSGFKIDATVSACDATGNNCNVYHVPLLQLPDGTTVVAANVTLSKAVAAVEDDLFTTKHQQSSLTPHPPCPPTGPGGCATVADGPEPVPICYPWPCVVPSDSEFWESTESR